MRSLVVGSYLLILTTFLGFMVFGQPRHSRSLSHGPGQFDRERAMEHARKIDALTRDAGGRRAGSRGNALVRAYVGDEMVRAGLRVHEEPFADMIGGRMVNIIGSLPGEKDEAILVCAHHDMDGPGTAAVDGTAGLAVLLELARACSHSPERTVRKGGSHARTVLFASWDGSSFACAGSTRFVASLSDDARRRLRAVVSLDSAGWKNGGAVIHIMPYTDRFAVKAVAPDWLVTRAANAARERGESLPVGDRWLGLVYQVLVRAVDIGDYSDDRPFLALGVPAMFLSDFSLTHSYPYSGTAADTIDQLGAAQIASVGRAVEAVVSDLSAADELPGGEADYLVFCPGLLKAFRLTGDEMGTLGALCLLPGGLVLIRRRRDGGLIVTRALFFAFATLFVIGMLADPIVFPCLVAPVLLAGPLLAVSSVRAVWGYLASLLPALLFGALIVPVYVTGSASLIRLTDLELSALAGLLTIGLIQAPLHYRRARLAGNRSSRDAFAPARFAPSPNQP